MNANVEQIVAIQRQLAETPLEIILVHAEKDIQETDIHALVWKSFFLKKHYFRLTIFFVVFYKYGNYPIQ